ncbi:SatD family protein [Roseovarius aestuariivivens]|uniref:SatD family protein n=1 Tax=Roseovarius aestuariivivens TaxID=1888910 RepID=UPI0010809F36|nr:SatD family protein [Roseovarius aestuariivivens]
MTSQNSPPIYAVFTGDLIGSRDAEPDAVEASLSVLRDTANRLGEQHDFDPRFTRSRGDGWQILLPQPRRLFDTYLALVASLTAQDTGLATKISIGIGQVSSAGSTDLSDADGPAFVAAGDMLDHLSTSSGPIRVAIEGPGSTQWQRGILRMTDWICQSWSRQQAEAVALYLLRPDLGANADRAAVLGITRQAFEARFKSSGFPALDYARQAFADHDFGSPA